MLGIIFLTAFVSIQSTTTGSKDIHSLFNTLKGLNVRDSTSEESSLGTSSSDNDDRANLVEQLRQMDLGKLLHLANRLKTLQREENKRLWSTTTDKFSLYKNNEPEKQVAGQYGDTEQLIKQLLHLQRKPNTVSHKQFYPNSLLSPSKTHFNDGWERTGALSNYSKIYIIADPETLKRNVNKGSASNWLSRLLEQTALATEKERESGNNNFWYKGKNIKDDLLSRRFKRNSKESYGGGGRSMEEDYPRPKRQRGGGGSGGGRTAIPYIRHRGDVYEKEM